MHGNPRTAGYVPYRRLARAVIATSSARGAARGTRAVASHDEDTTTMGVEAARVALRPGPGADARRRCGSPPPTPAYADKTNADRHHAALRLPAEVPRLRLGGALRSGIGALPAALAGDAAPCSWSRPTAATGCRAAPTRPPAATAAAALLVGDDAGPGARRVRGLGVGDRGVRRPLEGPRRAASRLWEERFGETRYAQLGPRR